MLIELIGWLGSVAILLAYFLAETKRLPVGSKKFQLLNLFGAIGLIINSWFHRAVPSVALNIIWLLIALYELVRSRRK